ncbi:MBL fold metallo-hydrolase [Sporosarcina sp. ACRSM]|uniref:MBL fold metallo-hydrolase n=1 Tax=Sporosarcina sp. ACRSM TaxID=2918216 RepID=UPI001EF4F9DA|nr:MBL fold metallo-hydrolase [Sporosarcina sp. ACRSM]MCG7335805.1 MBL fold metallo-hydrolase [Sporosarcina sp. ACRSM]
MVKLAVRMLGTGSPRPDLERSGPAQVLWIDDLPILIDCGEGTTTQLLKAGIPPHTINHLWLTHLHSDHLFGYAQFLIGGQGDGRRELTVVGPVGTKKYHERILQLYEEDINYRLSLGRSPKGLLDVNIIEIEEPGEISTDIPAKVTAAQMIHNVTTFGYRFEVGGKVVVISGDTAPTPEIVKLAAGADLLIQDAAITTTSVYTKGENKEFSKVFEKLQNEHCTPTQCGEIAQEAGVKKLVLTHFLPGADGEEAHEEVKRVYAGEVVIGEDLKLIEVIDELVGKPNSKIKCEVHS